MCVLASHDVGGSDSLLELEGQAAPNRADDVRRPALLAMLKAAQILVVVLQDKQHRAPARLCWRAPAPESLGDSHLHYEDSRCSHATDELVRRYEDGILACQCGVEAA